MRVRVGQSRTKHSVPCSQALVIVLWLKLSRDIRCSQDQAVCVCPDSRQTAFLLIAKQKQWQKIILWLLPFQSPHQRFYNRRENLRCPRHHQVKEWLETHGRAKRGRSICFITSPFFGSR